MAIPKFEDFLYPFMLHLMEKDSNKKDMIDSLSTYFKISDEDMKLKTRGGTNYQIYDRIGWCLQWLRRAMFVEIPQRGVWRITQRGREYMDFHSDLKESNLLEYPEFAEYSAGNSERNISSNNKLIQQRKDTAYMKHNDNWLEIIETIKPIIKQKLSFISYCNAVVTMFRLLGWKKSKGTLVTFNSVEAQEDGFLILLNIENENIQIPIISLDLNLEYSIDSQASSLNKAMKEVNSNIGILFAEEIKIYYHNSNEEVEPICILTIPFDEQVETGHALCNLLSYSTFSLKKLEDFCNELCDKIPSKSNLLKHISAIAQDSQMIEQFIADCLKNEGYDEDVVYEELNKYKFQINIKGLHQKDGIVIEEGHKNSHDTTKFSFDSGKTFLKKRYFVLEVIRRYIKENPLVTYDDLEKVFPSEIISKKRGVIRPLSVVQEWVKERPDVKSRYFMAENEIITLADGMQVVVHNQWGSHFPKFLAIANKMYDVISNKPYESVENVSEMVKESEPEQTRDFGIKISADSFSKFTNKK